MFKDIKYGSHRPKNNAQKKKLSLGNGNTEGGSGSGESGDDLFVVVSNQWAVTRAWTTAATTTTAVVTPSHPVRGRDNKTSLVRENSNETPNMTTFLHQ